MLTQLLTAVAAFAIFSAVSCGNDSYIDPSYDGETQYNEHIVSNYNETPTVDNCHAKAVHSYMDRNATLVDRLEDILIRLDDLIERGIRHPELLDPGVEWTIEFGGIAEELTTWMEEYGEMKVPIPMYHMHNYNLLSFVHVMKWKTDLAQWLLDGSRTQESLGDTLTRENEWAPKVQVEWGNYRFTCGEIYDGYKE